MYYNKRTTKSATTRTHTCIAIQGGYVYSIFFTKINTSFYKIKKKVAATQNQNQESDICVCVKIVFLFPQTA